jgi:transcription initiation factor TFIIB
LRKAFSELDILRDKLGLTDQIVERAAYIYRKVEDKGLIRGRTILGMLIAAVYIACRDSGKPRTIKDIASAINIRRKEISRNVRVLTFELDLQVPILDPIQCIAKVANTAMINESTRRLAFGLLRELLSSKILTVGKNPMGLAASILYIASKEMGEDISQEELARAAAVSEPTIRSRIKDIRKGLNICPTS